VDYESYRFEVVDMDGKRVDKVLVDIKHWVCLPEH
jgi:CBS domain containing-hemolysin-like protein